MAQQRIARIRCLAGMAGERQRVVHIAAWHALCGVWVSLCGITFDPAHTEEVRGGMPCNKCMALAASRDTTPVNIEREARPALPTAKPERAK